MVVTAQAFIDLDSARRFKRPPWDPKKEKEVSFIKRRDFVIDLFAELQMRVAATLATISPKQRITVQNSRLYHGWHRGKTETDDRKIWGEASRHFRSYVTSHASYLPDISFGNELVCGGKRVPIFDTLRTSDGVERQKLVDTSLVADLLSFTRTASAAFRRGEEPKVLALIIADDDDLFPGLFAAEMWGMKVLMLRVTRVDENKHTNVDGLIHRL